MTITVIIPSYNRPECIRENLKKLGEQRPVPEQIIIVDASPGDQTEQLIATEFPDVLYLRNPLGRGNTPHSRNFALRHATGSIIAFLDDDAFVHAGWAAALYASYADPSVAGVAGRALNGQPGEDVFGIDQIGRVLPDGRLTGNFAANPGRVIEVDHMIGCNMSLRADVVARLGGFRDDMRPGPFGICEETEICIRCRRLGYRLIFNPAVCADHVGAQQPGGRRFSPKYSYYHIKNNFAMVIRNYGLGFMAFRHAVGIAGQVTTEFVRKIGGAAAHLVSSAVGLVAGLVAGAYWLGRTGKGPTREGPAAEAIRKQLRDSSHGGGPGGAANPSVIKT